MGCKQCKNNCLNKENENVNELKKDEKENENKLKKDEKVYFKIIEENNKNINNDEKVKKENDYILKKKLEILEKENENLKIINEDLRKKNEEFIFLYSTRTDFVCREENENKEDNFSTSSSQSIKPNVFIHIKFGEKVYKFGIKKEYDLNKVLYRFKKQNKNLKPKGKFCYKGDEIDDLSKTCEYLGIKEGEYLYLV